MINMGPWRCAAARPTPLDCQAEFHRSTGTESAGAGPTRINDPVFLKKMLYCKASATGGVRERPARSRSPRERAAAAFGGTPSTR